MKTELEIGNYSDVGKVRKVNEDYYGSYKGAYGNLIVVCDGMGGYKGGAVASRIAVETIQNYFETLQSEFDPKEAIRNSLVMANTKIKEKASQNTELKDMGSTAVVLLIRDEMAFTGHIGDSRIYIVRQNQITQITKDHSLVQQMIDGGIITKEAAKNHPRRNVITRTLGADADNDPEIEECIQIFKDDKFILCSDGLTGYVNDDEIKNIVKSNSVQQACKILVDQANKRGGKDNITVQLVNITKGKKAAKIIQLKINKQSKRSTITNYVLIFVSTSLLFIFAIFAYYYICPAPETKVVLPPKKETPNKKNDHTISSQQKLKKPETNTLPFKNEPVRGMDSAPVKSKEEKKMAEEKKSDSTKSNKSNRRPKTE